MTTATSNTRLRCDSDATYQEWRDEFITKLGVLVAGGYLAADETNITAGAGARPTNSEQGYAVYHLNDSLHGTAPVYIRFGFGTGSSAANPAVWMTTGTSTDGSGVIGGTALSAKTRFNGNVGATTDTARPSYWSCSPGFFGVMWKIGAGAGEGYFFICRTCDSTGAITATGAQAYWAQGAVSTLTGVQAFRYAATAAAYTAQTSLASAALCFAPQSPTSTLVGSDTQVFVCWTITPQVAPLFGVCGVLDAEYGQGTTFSVAMVGSTTRTYIAGGSYCPVGPVSTSSSGPKLAMLWE